MRFILLLMMILLFSCENKKKTIVSRQQAIKKEMEEVKAFYFNKADSLDRLKEADTSSAKHFELTEKLIEADRKKFVMLIKLQKEYDSLEVELNAER